MSRSSRSGLVRAGLLAVIGALVLMVVGDRAQTAPTPDIGIDPLEILNLQIRANAIVVLDSSGSMAQTLEADTDSGDLAGDDPDSKLFQAKETLRTFIAANERKVSFQFGQYVQPGNGIGTVMTVPDSGIGRFLYTTTSLKAPSMVTNELVLDLRSTSLPTAQVMRMRENSATGTTPCPTAVPAGRYGTGHMLALAVVTAMNSCPGTNTYTVTVLNTHRFRFARTGASTQNWEIRWNEMGVANGVDLRNRLGGGTTNTGFLTTGNHDSAAAPTNFDRDLVRNNTVANNGGKFTESKTYYKLYGRRFFNGQVITVRPDGIACTITPLPGTTGVGGDGTSEAERPWLELVAATATCGAVAPEQRVRFVFGGIPRGDDFVGTSDDGDWRDWSSSTCGGFHSLVALQPCTNNAQLALVGPHLQKELPISTATRWPVGYVEDATTGAITTQPTLGGMRAGGFTPIAESLSDIDDIFTTVSWPVIRLYNSQQGPFPKTFVIFVTDGDDTCVGPSNTDTSAANANNMALRAARRAELLFTPVEGSPAAKREASSVTTFVISFGTGASLSRANWIAWGGSGMTRPTTDMGSPGGLRWTNAPATKEAGGCPQCKDAYAAANATQLADVLQSVIEQGQTIGVYSDQQSVTESIFELVYKAPNEARDPLSTARYDVTLPVLLQSTFSMPAFDGHLKAFRRAASGSVEEWDAGQVLQNRVAAGMATQATPWLFGPLSGGAGTTDANIRTSNAGIKRRIYTTLRNGVFTPSVNDLLTQTATGRTTLWPPAPAVDPPASGSTYPAGIFDDEMGLTGLSLAVLQSTFGACTAAAGGGALPLDCTLASGRAVKEARQIVLAYMAGAQLVKNGADAIRDVTTREIQFTVRPWIMAESTLAAPAAVGPPSDEEVLLHKPEWEFFLSGGTAASRRMGFGLREPATGSQPVMSIVYHAANDMLHAFRGGPCNVGNNCPGTSVAELGGEELWGFVPYDLLGSLKARLRPQTRNDHTFMLATPLRFADVFVPGTFTVSPEGTPISGAGVWRVVLFMGRGIGGKYLTALDVTAPGEFTKHSLDTNGPIPLWNRGNPDTQDGLAAGPVNNTAADATAYRRMGQTWSVPAVGMVETPTLYATTRKPTGMEHVAWVGSGYGDTTGCPSSTPCEGSTFFTLDPLTGDVVTSINVGQRNNATVPFANVIVAGPSAFSAPRVSFSLAGSISENGAPVTRVYFNDIHGRLHRVMANAPSTSTILADVNGTGPTQQPLGVSTALLFYEPTVGQPKRPMIFTESGNDNRIFLPTAPVPTTPPFRAYAFADMDSSVTTIFTKDFPNLYRGTSQPATAFTRDELGRVFFGGTRFNPAGTVNAPPPPPCRSSFSSVVFALGAATGNAAYDLNSGSTQDEYMEYVDEKIMSTQVVRGQLVVDRGLGAEIAPTPPPSIEIEPPAANGSVFSGLNIPQRFAVANRDTLYTAQPTVCR